MLDSNLDTAAETVLVEAVFCPGASVADAASVLDARKHFLRLDSGVIVQWMVIPELTLYGLAGGWMWWIHGHEHIRVRFRGNVLKDVHVVSETDARCA